MSKLSLKGKLLLASWLFAVGVAFVLTLALHTHNKRQLLGQLEKTLEAKCDEVVTVLGSSSRSLPILINHFLRIETEYRDANPTYFYQITDDTGALLARSENLGNAGLPIPNWSTLQTASVHVESEPHPIAPGERVRIRSERVRLAMAGSSEGTLVIQTAGSLEAFEVAIQETLRRALLAGASTLALIFLPLWFVATKCLSPVTAMTRKASQITAANLPERLPRSGTGDELDELAMVLNDMLERVAFALRQVQQFSSDASHQLRTPLTRIRVTLDVLLRDDESLPWRSELESIREETDRLSRLCSRLLLLARLDPRGPEAEENEGISSSERVDLGGVASELVEQLTPLALESGIELVLEPSLASGAATRTEVPGSRALLAEALFNLLENAIHATAAGGSVRLSVEARSGEACVSVSDSGPGVPVEERQRIFNRFYRVSAEAHPDNTGLGLAIVKSIAEAHGGRVEVDDAPVRGAVFRLILPTRYSVSHRFLMKTF